MQAKVFDWEQNEKKKQENQKRFGNKIENRSF